MSDSKQARKIDQLRETIDQLHERLASVQSSKRNKASQIARLTKVICATVVDMDETVGDVWPTARNELIDAVGPIAFAKYRSESA
jgi:hypothetical protein